MHIAATGLCNRTSAFFGDDPHGGIDMNDPRRIPTDLPGTADEAIEFTERAYRAWTAGITSLDDKAMARSSARRAATTPTTRWPASFSTSTAKSSTTAGDWSPPRPVRAALRQDMFPVRGVLTAAPVGQRSSRLRRRVLPGPGTRSKPASRGQPTAWR